MSLGFLSAAQMIKAWPEFSIKLNGFVLSVRAEDGDDKFRKKQHKK